jgi:serine/threonine-protein kinase
MASLYLGKVEGPGGFSKRVVLKRILPQHAENPAFVEMFLGEARLAAMLSHPNVVQVYDFGRDGPHYFMAMEYVDGVSLRTVFNHLKKQGRRFPVRAAVYAMVQVCAGLAYAHSAKDESGQPLNLIHRDVSPDNLLVTRTGVAKLVDFGIAKAASVTQQTTAGMVKGKLAYMPPEQVSGGELDARVDVYAVGVSLYELLCGQRPFIAGNELELALMVMERAPAPVLELAPEAGPELAEIIERAMAKDRAKRYGSARELKDALEHWLEGQTRQAEAELVSLLAQVHPAAPPQAPVPVTAPAPDEPATTPTTPLRSPDGPVAPSRSRRLALALGVASVALFGAALAVAFFPRQPAQAPRAPVVEPVGSLPAAEVPPLPEPAGPPAPEPPAAAEPEAPVAPPKAARKADGYLSLRSNPWCEVTLDGTPAGQTPLVKVKVSAGSHVVQLSNPKFGFTQRLTVAVPAGQTVVRTVTAPVGQLEVEAPAGTKVFLGSELLGVAPMAPVPLVAGRHTLGYVNGPGGQKGARDVTVKAGGRATLRLP